MEMMMMTEHEQIELRRWALGLASHRRDPSEPATVVVEGVRVFEVYVANGSQVTRPPEMDYGGVTQQDL